MRRPQRIPCESLRVPGCHSPLEVERAPVAVRRPDTPRRRGTDVTVLTAPQGWLTARGEGEVVIRSVRRRRALSDIDTSGRLPRCSCAATSGRRSVSRPVLVPASCWCAAQTGHCRCAVRPSRWGRGPRCALPGAGRRSQSRPRCAGGRSWRCLDRPVGFQSGGVGVPVGGRAGSHTCLSRPGRVQRGQPSPANALWGSTAADPEPASDRGRSPSWGSCATPGTHTSAATSLVTRRKPWSTTSPDAGG